MSHRAAWLAWSVCGLTVVLIACAVALAFLNRSDVGAVIFPLALTLSAVVGGLVASRRPENPVGWFFLGSAGCFAITAVAAEYATYGLPGEIPDMGIVNPLGVEALRPVSELLEPIYLALYFFLFFASAASLVVRFRRSGSLERQQIKWLAFAALAVPVWFLTHAPIEAASHTLFIVMDALIFSALIPVAAGVAILRYRLYDIDVVINRTLVYGTLTVLLAAVYLGGVATT